MEERTISASGFSGFMSKVFMWMFLGLLATAGVAYYVANSSLMAMFYRNMPIFFAFIIAEVIIVVILSRKVMKMSYGATVSMFMLYAILNGVTMSVLVSVYAKEEVSIAFFITAGLFGVMALYGMLTKTDLSPFRAFFFIAIVGLILASVVNAFVGSDTMSYVISLAGVVIFAGLTAYDMQKMKRYYAISESEGGIREGNFAVSGALHLYLDFINLFVYVLRLVGRRR